MASIMIEIEYPWEAQSLLSNDFIDESHSAQAFRLDLIKKIQRGILLEEYRKVWRQIESFPKYEINGGGMIRDRKTREYVTVTVISEEPVMVQLDDRNGWACNISLEKLIDDNFPELKEW